MRKKLTGYMAGMAMVISLLAPVQVSQAAAAKVKVTLPDFAVSLNGNTVENQYREYPMLVYKDITYFPMTWYDTRLLGLEAVWTPEAGLDIKQSPVTSSYMPYITANSNAASYAAEVPASTVTINGKVVDNTKEPYPLLSFRDVTYFPLTWRFAHDEFGWEYEWDEGGGLRITSHNPQVQPARLPVSVRDNDVALYQGAYYSVETVDEVNHVYRRPESSSDWKEVHEVYSYNVNPNNYGVQKQLTFLIRDKALWFTRHLGGGIMGHDEFVKIGENGKGELVHEGYLDFRDTAYGTLIVRLGSSAFEGGNLYLSPSGEDGADLKKVGDPKLMYSVKRNGSGWVLGPGSDTPNLHVVGEDVYVLASRDDVDANKIYTINVNTNKSVKVIDTEVDSFRVLDKKLYYIKQSDNMLYASALDGTGEVKLSDHAVSWFDAIDGNVFYTSKTETYQNQLYRADPAGDDPLVWDTPVAEAKVANGTLVCLFGENEQYGAALLDGSGRLLVKIADPVKKVLLSDKGVLFRSSREDAILLISED